MHTLRAMLGCGVPVNKIKVLRRCLEGVAGLSLVDDPTRLKADCLDGIVMVEKDQQTSEVAGKLVSTVFDGTPRQGDVTCVIVRCVAVTDGVASIQQRLVHLDFAAKSLDSIGILGVVTRGLQSVGLRVSSVLSTSCDGCPTNVAMHRRFEHLNRLTYLLAQRVSHCANDAGEKTSLSCWTASGAWCKR